MRFIGLAGARGRPNHPKNKSAAAERSTPSLHPKARIGHNATIDAQGDAMRKRKKYEKFTPRAATPKDEQAKELVRMADALATYQGPITKCPPGSVEDSALSASARVAKRPSRVR
jgi:hypothetical protein